MWFHGPLTDDFTFIQLLFPPGRRDVTGWRVLITGGGHGIGREMALEFGRLGADVILWDINVEDMENTADDVRAVGAKVSTYTCDVSRADDIKDVAERLRGDVGGVDVLVNNAGVLNGGTFLEMTSADIRKTFEVNTLAQFWTVREFLPGMIDRNRGVILNIASASAKSGTAYLVDYSSSKAAVLVFSEALAEEMALLGYSWIQVTVVCPAFVSTGLCRNPKDRINRLLSPRETALAAIDGMLRGEFVVHVPKSLWLGLKFSEMLPERAHMRIKSSLNLGIDPQYSPPVIAKVKDKEKCQGITDLDQVPGEDNIHCLQ
ncbi:estradiol 17-beta-dehydrogenase 11-like isoform X2 [Haliotis rufescens]|uniref:estradiol 17-beta-dehydrogenase 11-like isoform X2 n=1 Tax=Haliotis rufescens TaxID=6454 RepID=UPI00201EF4BB|nr:estradiol 17-beta-dehydrogenase 11-like isoform X2 [Haliotis rufescens]